MQVKARTTSTHGFCKGTLKTRKPPVALLTHSQAVWRTRKHRPRVQSIWRFDPSQDVNIFRRDSTRPIGTRRQPMQYDIILHARTHLSEAGQVRECYGASKARPVFLCNRPFHALLQHTPSWYANCITQNQYQTGKAKGHRHSGFFHPGFHSEVLASSPPPPHRRRAAGSNSSAKSGFCAAASSGSLAGSHGTARPRPRDTKGMC